ncbi:hypothetical protein K501DRAFT_273902 [Backusella circina FSU 941]|nr:hypothetical protein K501DRAFT_273902 [Backusella circina FSU 941]
MFSSLAVVTFLAASLVNAAPTARATTDCNPSYNVAGSTECFTNCNIASITTVLFIYLFAAGNAFVPGWTMDSTSPLFIDSLELMCDRNGTNYRTFMTNAGMCMASCTGDDPELFNAEWSGACAWWAEHKDDTCSA